MSEDRSLSEFTGTGGDTDAGDDESERVDDAAVETEDGTGIADGTDADDGTDAAEYTVSPTTITAEWTPDGAECENCEETVQRRWRDGEADDDPDLLVCADCKTW